MASITALDYDPLSSDDVIDRQQRKVTVLPTSWVSPTKWRQTSLGGSPSTTILQYSVQCNQDYYGPSCTTYCIARDDDIAGHYTCDKASGHKVCRAGWHGVSCKVYCVPHDDDTRGHYTCESGTGRKICLQDWYGPSCTVHCAARNDSLAGYTCDSRPRGKKFVCRTGMVKPSATYIVNRPMITKLVTPATQMETKYVYKDGMAHHVIVRQGMIRPWVTRVILPTGKESV